MKKERREGGKKRGGDGDCGTDYNVWALTERGVGAEQKKKKKKGYGQGCRAGDTEEKIGHHDKHASG